MKEIVIILYYETKEISEESNRIVGINRISYHNQ